MLGKYDIFLSYRRLGGAETAKHLRDSLTERGYSVFLDVESLRSGEFDKGLYEVIDKAKDFILILPPGGLDRCQDENDWVRLEIEYARKRQKNIIPILLNGFEFPDTLPESIAFIRTQNGPAKAGAEYYDAFVDRLEEFLLSKPWPKWKKRAAIGCAVILTIAIILTARFFLTTYPVFQKDFNLVSDTITFMTSNLMKVDTAGEYYLKGLGRAIASIEGKVSASTDDLNYELSNCSKIIVEQGQELEDMSDSLHSALMHSPFDLGDIDAMRTVLKTTINNYADTLDFIRINVLEADELEKQTRLDYVDTLKSMARLDAEILFYTLNESLLPVTNEKALGVLKKEILPRMSFIYERRLDLTHDKGLLLGKEEAIYQQYQALVKTLEEITAREEGLMLYSMVEERLSGLIEFYESTGGDASALKEQLNRIKEKKKKLEEDKAELVEIRDEIKRQKDIAREQFKPLDTDSQETLLGKGKRFLTLKMYEEAEQCFSIFNERAEGTDEILGTVAVKFSRNCARLGITGGVVVYGYEEGKLHQDISIGDIIIQVNGQSIKNLTEYSHAKDGISKSDIVVLRFTADGYELVDKEIDSGLGRLYLFGLTDEPE